MAGKSTEVHSSDNYYSFRTSDEEFSLRISPDGEVLTVGIWEGDKLYAETFPAREILPSLTGWLHDRLKED